MFTPRKACKPQAGRFASLRHPPRPLYPRKRDIAEPGCKFLPLQESENARARPIIHRNRCKSRRHFSCFCVDCGMWIRVAAIGNTFKMHKEIVCLGPNQYQHQQLCIRDGLTWYRILLAKGLIATSACDDLPVEYMPSCFCRHDPTMANLWSFASIWYFWQVVSAFGRHYPSYDPHKMTVAPWLCRKASVLLSPICKFCRHPRPKNGSAQASWQFRCLNSTNIFIRTSNSNQKFVCNAYSLH